jgi:tRNA pseudouridine55 synthase
MGKTQWRDINGILLLDKPSPLSSNDALQTARRIFRARKGGHGGTLDPLATGLLPIAFGQATKFLNDLLDAPKTYIADVRLGAISNTGDEEGEITETEQTDSVASIPRDQVKQALSRLTGEVSQQPPMYSAVKHNGKPLYKYARKGQEVDRPARQITIYSLDLIDCDLPAKTIKVRTQCSKGTYIRVLAEDIGRELGCGAYLKQLRREAVAGFDVAQSHTLDHLKALFTDDDALLGSLAPVDAMLAALPKHSITLSEAKKFTQGQAIAIDALVVQTLKNAERCRVYADEQFLGVATIENNEIAPRRLVVSGE